MFLSETKSSVSEIRRIQSRIGFDHSDSVEAVGRSGSLAVFWEDSVILNTVSKNNHIIDVNLKDGSRFEWRCSGIYGWAESGHKSKTWVLITDLGKNNSLPWLIGGDLMRYSLMTKKERDRCGLQFG